MPYGHDDGSCSYVMCEQCGQFICGDCSNRAETWGKHNLCPKCRVHMCSICVSDEEKVSRLTALLQRSAGPHTPHAWYELALRNVSGKGVAKKNLIKAEELYRLAAVAGHPQGI